VVQARIQLPPVARLAQSKPCDCHIIEVEIFVADGPVRPTSALGWALRRGAGSGGPLVAEANSVALDLRLHGGSATQKSVARMR
jgi:hypothetical protein